MTVTTLTAFLVDDNVEGRRRPVSADAGATVGGACAGRGARDAAVVGARHGSLRARGCSTRSAERFERHLLEPQRRGAGSPRRIGLFRGAHPLYTIVLTSTDPPPPSLSCGVWVFGDCPDIAELAREAHPLYTRFEATLGDAVDTGLLKEAARCGGSGASQQEEDEVVSSVRGVPMAAQLEHVEVSRGHVMTVCVTSGLPPLKQLAVMPRTWRRSRPRGRSRSCPRSPPSSGARSA